MRLGEMQRHMPRLAAFVQRLHRLDRPGGEPVRLRVFERDGIRLAHKAVRVRDFGVAALPKGTVIPLADVRIVSERSRVHVRIDPPLAKKGRGISVVRERFRPSELLRPQEADRQEAIVIPQRAERFRPAAVEHGLPRRTADRKMGIGLREQSALFRKPVQIRRMHGIFAAAADAVVTELIGGNEQDIGLSFVHGYSSLLFSPSSGTGSANSRHGGRTSG